MLTEKKKTMVAISLCYWKTNLRPEVVRCNIAISFNGGELFELFFALFSYRFIKIRVDYQGRQRTFRPCPVFILTQLSPGWCGGVLTGVW